MADTAYGANAAQRPSNPSCFGSISHVAGSVASLRSRLNDIVNRLAGSYPEPPGNGKAEIRPAPNGLLEEAQAGASTISDSVDVMNAALDRLEKYLP